MKRLRVILSVAWCSIWTVFALFCASSARGPAPIRNPMGPAFTPQPEATRGVFGVLGDCHSYRRSLRAFLRTAGGRGGQFGILLGDFVDYDEEIAYHHFADRLGTPPFPVFLARGNHEATDFRLNDTDRYREHIPQTSHFLRHAGALIGILDNGTGDFPEDCLAQARMELSSFRQEHPDAPILLAMHIPPTLQGSRSDDLSASATGAILDLCSEFQVDYLVCGHVHDHLELIHNSTTVVIDGCGGGSLRGPSSAVHYLEFTIRDGGLTFEPVALARDNMILAKGDYLLHVSIPRYRWWFVLLASVLVLREIHSLRKMRQAKRPTTALASP